MGTTKAFIEEMEADVQYHARMIIFWMSRLTNLRRRKLTKRYSKGSRELYCSLIEFHGRTNGLRKWAEHLRNRRWELLHLKERIRFHRDQRFAAKALLEIYQEK